MNRCSRVVFVAGVAKFAEKVVSDPSTLQQNLLPHVMLLSHKSDRESKSFLSTSSSIIDAVGADRGRLQQMPNTSHRYLVILLGTALSKEHFQMR